jgi:chitin synthase
MSYNPRSLGAPTYARQTSFEDSSGGEGASSSARYGGAPASSSNVNRRPTVRGAVRGTVREAGANPRMSMAAIPGRALTRGKTLTRPDRFVAPAPLINPGLAPGGKTSGGAVQTKLVDGKPTLITSEPWWEPWSLFVEVSTWWAPRWLLRRTGMTDPVKQRAWKEKCALCTISAILMAIIGFITIGLNRTLCPSDATTRFTRLGSDSGEWWF